MINSAIKYCKDNKIQFVQSELELEGIKAELIATTEKKLFTTKKNNLYFGKHTTQTGHHYHRQ